MAVYSAYFLLDSDLNMSSTDKGHWCSYLSQHKPAAEKNSISLDRCWWYRFQSFIKLGDIISSFAEFSLRSVLLHLSVSSSFVHDVLKFLWKTRILIHYFTFTGTWFWRLNCTEESLKHFLWIWGGSRFTKIHKYSNNLYFQKIRLNIKNPRKLF